MHCRCIPFCLEHFPFFRSSIAAQQYNLSVFCTYTRASFIFPVESSLSGSLSIDLHKFSCTAFNPADVLAVVRVSISLDRRTLCFVQIVGVCEFLRFPSRSMHNHHHSVAFSGILKSVDCFCPFSF